MGYVPTCRATIIAMITLTAAASVSVAAMAAQTTSTSAPVEMKDNIPPAVSIVRVKPGPLVVTKTISPLDDGSQRALITSTVTNHPIPDSPEARKAFGGPDSATGRATAPHPGPAGNVETDAPPAPAPK